jgi:hypothetical protein
LEQAVRVANSRAAGGRGLKGAIKPVGRAGKLFDTAREMVRCGACC